MKIPKKDLKIETIRGSGSGGQHKNKTDSAVRITHIPTGIQAYVDGRDQHKNKKQALKEINDRISLLKQEKQAEQKKVNRDQKVKTPKTAIRTYNEKTKIVKDHRTNKTASIKDVLLKGNIDLLK